ncbi:restriction endonuclease [Streptobacillus ratti]|uniref:restriction endonuclease n=1 Tax=Streptobacillus ratti TaxID=1720557 RepID=UPI000933177E|nr:restriction endonuclease [Streptobacillus ratti]
MKNRLSIELLKEEAKNFCEKQSKINHKLLIGITDGKAVGTYVEHLFKDELNKKYNLEMGNSSKGIDFPEENINTDIKVTSIKQPQSSCPFRSARQKIFGLGYNLLIFVYEKIDIENTCKLNFLFCSFIEKDKTSDYTITKRLIEMKKDGANKEDIIGYLYDKNIPGDETIYNDLATEILSSHLQQGYLTISNALQWRLQYGRVIQLDNKIKGITNYVWKD